MEDLINTEWEITGGLSYSDGSSQHIKFLGNGQFCYAKAGYLDRFPFSGEETWQLIDNTITISYNNDFMIRIGTLSSDLRIMEGTWKSESGEKGDWYGKILSASKPEAISKIQNEPPYPGDVDKIKISRFSLLQSIRDKVKEDLNNQKYKETVSHRQADWIEINRDIERLEDVDATADNYNPDETEIIKVCLGNILEVWLYDITGHRGSIFTQYINTDDLEDWGINTSEKVPNKEIEEWLNSCISNLYHYFEEEIYLDSDDIGDINLQIQSPSFTLKDLNPNWDSDEHYIEDEKMENFINDII